jgi:hypothetical protein
MFVIVFIYRSTLIPNLNLTCLLFLVYRRPNAEPDLVPRGEGAAGVQQGQDGHEAGQEDLLPLLPRNIKR